MRMTIGLILWAGVANTAFAHPVDGSFTAALSHQVFGAHHLLFTFALIAFVLYLGRRWHRRDRV
ncbi:MAG: hypothetical protein OEW73_15230 [Gammaproteobacteria bacterium]|nr:hypothetical protein [Gammaproteobacteria bacterium]